MTFNHATKPDGHAYNPHRKSINTALRRNVWTIPTYYKYEHTVYYDGVPGTPIILHMKHFDPDTHEQKGDVETSTIFPRQAIRRSAGTYISVMSPIEVEGSEFLNCDKDFGEGDGRG